MKRLFLGVILLGLTFTCFAQEKNYFFNGVFDNDCYNGNIAVNSTKKMTINLQNDGASLKYTIKSIGCTKEEELINLGSEKIYYNEDEKVGVILEGENLLYLIKEEEDKYSFSAIVIMKTESGKCKWEQVILRQNYNGSSYGNTYWHGNSQRIYPVDRKEALKYK